MKIAIGLGSNLGDSRAILEGAIVQIAAHPRIVLGDRSPWYRTPPLGPPQPDYLNGCILCTTYLEPEGLLDVLQAIERHFGRERGEHWGPRTLDLDLLLWGDRQIHHPRLTVPHPHFRQRAFVLLPLMAIAPQWCDPVTGYTIAQLWERLSATERAAIRAI